MTVQPHSYQPRSVSDHEVERIRLLLSTYQDGTGQYGGGFEPGWRDFERVTALAFGGIAQESKSIFDVLVPDAKLAATYYGIACKMREALDYTLRTNRVVVEVSNAAAKFGAEVVQRGYDQNMLAHPSEVGSLIVNLVKSWMAEASLNTSDAVDVLRSFYLVLSYTKKTRQRPTRMYQLHQFAPTLPDPTALEWSWPETKRGQKRLVGVDREGKVILEWYNTSGGQLKYYPHEKQASWCSPIFQLEPLPPGEYSIVNKAASYFPEAWWRCQP